MSVIITISTNTILFKVCAEDSKYNPLKSLPGWCFINPLLFNQANNLSLDTKDYHILGMKGDCAYIRSRRIFLAYDDGEYTGTPNIDAIPETVEIDRFLQKLRYVCKNENIPTKLYGGDIIHQPVFFLDLPEPDMPIARKSDRSRGYILRNAIDKAITWTRVLQADALPQDFEPPIYDGLLLDAISAYHSKDFRRAILFAAMSIEVAVSSTLDSIYEQDKIAGGTNLNLRTNKIRRPKRAELFKDPVYELLTSTGNSFNQLLHERCLYVLRKSLQFENENTYQLAIKVYKTRNKIVHYGYTPKISGEELVPINKSGAEASIDCAYHIIHWLGISEQYPYIGEDSMEVNLVYDKRLDE